MYTFLRQLIRKEKELPIREVLSAKPFRNPEVKWAKAPNGQVGIRPSSEGKRLIALDALGSFVWEMCDGRHKFEGIIKGLCEEFKLSRQEAEVSLRAYLLQLQNKGLIEIKLPEVSAEERKKTEYLEEMRLPDI